MNPHSPGSSKIRVLTILGTRPEGIKLAPIVMACQQHSQVEHHLCATGQHREMLAQVFRVFGLKPQHSLELMQPGQSLTQLTAQTLLGSQRVIREVRPDWVVVQGDTTTAFTGALAAFYEGVPVVHVEAGLRTGNLMSPWPEELNRRIVGLMAKVHCAPTQWAADNLLREGIPPEHLVVTGNSVIDALQWVDAQPGTAGALENFLGPRAHAILGVGRRVLLVTGHRRENLDSGLAQMCQALKQLAGRGDIEIVFPVHLNPAVRSQVYALLGNVEHVHLTDPMDYQSFVGLLRRSYLVITDSGGLQEEAPGLGKPVLVTRDTTERPEAIEAGTALLVGRDPDDLIMQTTRLLEDAAAYGAMANAHNPYGDGHAAPRILAEILRRSRAAS